MAVTEWTAEEVFNRILNKEALFIFDVRNETEFGEWKIEGEKIEHLNIPYFELLDGIDDVKDKIPTDKEILVVCAIEGSSQMIAEMLSEAGFDVAYLQGGMKTWSEYLYRTKVYQDEDIAVYQFIRPGKGCLSYMVTSGEEALIVDPLRFADVFEQAADELGVKITHVVDSHLHADHISGGPSLAETTGAQYYLMKSEGAVFDFEPLEKHERIQFEKVDVEVLAVKTPGHTPGSVSFFVNQKLLFSGDTIFVSGLGRPDLGGKVREWAVDLYNTIYEKVSQIADDVIVLPAHYADLDKELIESQEVYVGDTLGNIRARNDIMLNKAKDEFVEHVAHSASSETPPNFEQIIAINRGLEVANSEKQLELEIGPNRCAVHHTS